MDKISEKLVPHITGEQSFVTSMTVYHTFRLVLVCLDYRALQAHVGVHIIMVFKGLYWFPARTEQKLCLVAQVS